jgi:hypothetical protein
MTGAMIPDRADHDGQHILDSARLAAALAALGPLDPVLAQVITGLHVRVYPGDVSAGDRTGYVVVDIHGVSIGVQRRAGDLYLHADTTETPDRSIAFEVNGGGETDHSTH